MREKSGFGRRGKKDAILVPFSLLRHRFDHSNHHQAAAQRELANAFFHSHSLSSVSKSFVREKEVENAGEFR